MMALRISVLLSLILAVPDSPASAQQAQLGPCGDPDGGQRWATALEVILESPEYVSFRAEKGLPVEATTPVVVTEAAECARVANALRTHLRQRDDWSRLQREGYTWTVIRAGDRYAVPVMFGSRVAEDITFGGHTPVFIFGKPGELLGVFLR